MPLNPLQPYRGLFYRFTITILFPVILGADSSFNLLVREYQTTLKSVLRDIIVGVRNNRHTIFSNELLKRCFPVTEYFTACL